MTKFKKDDYVEGFENYGNTIRRTKGWVNSVRECDGYILVDIQCDDHYKGCRANYLDSSLGNIWKLKDKERPLRR